LLSVDLIANLMLVSGPFENAAEFGGEERTRHDVVPFQRRAHHDDAVGAVVGVQPFGGCGLSGTGPKAGGPHYLARFASEQTISINTAAVGGNASLLSLAEE